MAVSIDEFFDTLDGWADRTPGQLALASRAGFMNYEDLVGNIASASVHAMQSGIRPGQLVVVAVANPDMALILALALMRIGCRVGYVRDLDLFDSRGVAVDAVLADPKAAPSSHRTIPVTPQWFAGAQARSLSLPAPAPGFSVIFSSSGSTGTPKLVEVLAPALAYRLSSRKGPVFEMPRVRVLSTFGSRTTTSFLDSLFALASGGTIVRPVDRRSTTILDTLQLFAPDYVIVTPSILADLLRTLDVRPRSLRKIRVLRVGGAYCAPTLQNAALDRLAEELQLTYGTTEAGWIADGLAREIQKIANSVGKVFDNIEIAAFGGDGRMLPTGSEGEIRVKPPAEAVSGYLGNQAASTAVFIDGWFKTGDIGLIDADRNLIIRGRATNVINTGGGKVNPELLEDHLRTMPGIIDVGITGVAVPEGYEKVCAAVVSDARPSIEAINGHLVERREFSPIRAVKYVDALPHTQNGKIDRVALKRLCAE